MSLKRDAAWQELAELSAYHLQAGWLLARWLEKHPVRGAVLDVGCGTMPFRGLFEPETPCYGIDMAVPVHTPAPVVIGRMERLPFHKGAFSAVLSMFSVHQVRELGTSLQEMRRVLAERGTLFLTVPSRAYWVYRLPPPLRSKSVIVHRSFARRELARLLEDSGFEIATIHGCGGVLGQFYENALWWIHRWRGARARSESVRVPARPHQMVRNNPSSTAKLRVFMAAVERFTGAWWLGSGIWFLVAVRRSD